MSSARRPRLSVDEFLELAKRFAQIYWPGEMPEEVRIVMVGGKTKRLALLGSCESIVAGREHDDLPSTNEPSGGLLPNEEAEIPSGSDHFSPCISDILEALEKARRPLTTTRLLDALNRGGKEWGRRTVEQYLAMMIQDGTIENPKGSKPAGYRLPEWTADKE